MYGLIGKMMAAPGKRDEFIAILVEGIGNMPGCLSYIVATDPADANAIWITEVSERGESRRVAVAAASEGSHRQGAALIAGFGERFITTPVGGHGLLATKPR